MRKLMAVATAGVMGLTGVTVATTAGGQTASASAVAPANTIAWTACEDATLVDAGAECGFVSVPLSYAEPDGAKIEVAVSRVKATDANRQGVMLVNPGGPGGSGLVFPAILPQRVPNGIGAQYDWIGFDPRGVGSSRPAVSCIPDFNAGPRPAYMPASETTRAINEQQWLARTKAFADACRKNGALIENMKTIDTIRDMDAIRVALGEEQINFYGFSYGTFLGQTYSTRYPDRVRRMVLDGNVEPSYGGYDDGGRSQTLALESVLNEFFGWIAQRNAVYGLGADRDVVIDAHLDEIEKLTAMPVDEIGASEWQDVFLIAAYTESLWTIVADAFADWRAGDTTRMKFIYSVVSDPTNDNSLAAFNSTLCTDGQFPKDYDKVRADGFALAKEAPLVAWGSFWFSQPCTFWPVKAGETPAVDGDAVDIPFLLINATGDGATPYAGAIAVRNEFPTAVLLAEVGATTHSGSLGGNLCVDDLIAAYLADGSLPERQAGNEADITCDRKPLPEPSLIDRGFPAGSAIGLPPPLDMIERAVPIAYRF